MSLKSTMEDKADTEYQVKQRQTDILIEQQRQISALHEKLDQMSLQLKRLDALDKLKPQIEECRTNASEASACSLFALGATVVIILIGLFGLWYLWGIPAKIDVINNALYLLLQDK